MAETVNVPRKPGLWQRMSGCDSRHPLLWNLVPVAVYTLILPLALIGASGEFRLLGLQLVLAAVLLVPLVWRRRFPFTVLASQLVPISMAVTMGVSGVNFSLVDVAMGIAYTLALYNLVLRRPLKLLWWAALISVGPDVLALALGTPAEAAAGQRVSTVFESMFFFGFVVVVGLLVRTRRNYQHSERHLAAREAVQEERARIAREMHDIIGHNLAVISALADGGAYAAAASPERAREALTTIGSTSRQALGELRRVLSVLQDETGEAAELAPQPGLADLGRLVDRVREAGLPVVFKVSGDPWTLTENQQLSVYRTVQEALTNVIKHARGPRRARVELDYGEDALEVVIVNTGAVVADGGSPSGLLGLRERAAAFGGTMEAGPHPGGGWRVAVRLPREAPDHLSRTSPGKERTQ